MANLKEFQDKMASLLGLSEQDLMDFREAADHDKECLCNLCKKYHLIIKGKYKS
jgi:hypothetical protein